jgi:glycosyltransferase involved in cell wall biosynthesis
MKVLFLSSGNSGALSAIVKAQADSLRAMGLDVTNELIIGKGLLGYLKNIPQVRKKMKEHNYDIVHAHYSFCGFVATLSGAKNTVVSLMGSDVKAKGSMKRLIKLFVTFSWKQTIVKSKDMQISCGLKNAHIIPNGVDTQRFTPGAKYESMRRLGWDPEKQHVLFAASGSRAEKNFPLAKAAFDLLDASAIELHTLEKVPFAEIALWHTAADVVFLTSKYEGSPNVIKEAMACSRPIVATDVGDIAEVFGDTEGCYLAEPDAVQLSKKLKEALAFSHSHTSGAERIRALKLDSVSIAHKLHHLYRSVLERP